ncbi:DUF6712 family protein [Roseivirga thermotolerans]|uniref:Uncharacterized protein n=1 Tax=Roseivirga thermotolerans TaxID=1758176 RepID=A0ABQ3I4Z1_9BACT|nr:DUF6712 family protein [Roseivirga thermotolerans]GHE64970.1 hypothetical protein GCM10011340_19980 [Roseivirga thermotolerans]
MLFKTTDEIKDYISIDVNTALDSLSPFIREAEILFILPLLGDAMYTTLDEDYNDSENPLSTEDNAALMPYVQRCLAYYAGFLSIDELGVNMGDAGIMQTRADNSEPAPKWKVDNLKANRINQADIHAEKLLSYLEKTASVSVLNDWYSSTANTIAEGRILRTAEQASQYIDINNSRRFFLRMKSRIKEVEESFIMQLIGEDQYSELVTQIKADSLKNDAENKALVKKLEPIVAKMALYETLPFIRVQITDQGITIITTNDSTITKMAASDSQVDKLRWQLKQSPLSGFQADIDKLKKFIEDNIDDYPLIEASTAYTSKPDPGPNRPPVIDPTKKHVSV